MVTMSAMELLNVWEQGQSQPPLWRALTLLCTVCPEYSREDLLAFSLGTRDLLLLELHERAFGPTLEGFAGCPNCNEPLEFTLQTVELRAQHSADCDDTLEIPEERLSLRFRLPNSHDLAAALEMEDTEEAASALARWCILAVKRGGRTVAVEKLSQSVLERVSERMAQCDPLAEIRLYLSCPACSHHWHALFDILTFVWKEIASRAKRLIDEIHTLAMTYHWSEAEILALTPQRRQWYLERIVQ